MHNIKKMMYIIKCREKHIPKRKTDADEVRFLVQKRPDLLDSIYQEYLELFEEKYKIIPLDAEEKEIIKHL